MQQLGSAFKDHTVEASDGKAGTVSDFLFDDRTWKLRWLVVNIGDGLIERKILIHPSSLARPDFELRALPVNLTRAQVEGSPGIQHDQPVSRQMEARQLGYYGHDPLWAGDVYSGYPSGDSGVRPIVSAPVTADNREGGPSGSVAAADSHQPDEADPHLRSIAEVSGYRIHAMDGDIGHIDDFLMDDEAWAINFLVVDTSDWWFGKHVLVSPSAIQEIIWRERCVRLNLTCYKIKGSPPWKRSGVIDRAYEQLLHAYYGWPTKDDPERPAEHPASLQTAEQARAPSQTATAQ